MTAPGSNLTPWGQMERPAKAHAVEWGPKYRRHERSEDALLGCICGWDGTVEDWSQHAPNLSVSVPGREHDYYGARGRITAPSRFVR